ncbi:MAG: polymerase sigma factor [Acidimicrobiales bacterium]|nr:polymerase sigma factor [Acidimicrobiales bacterium]
MDLPPAEVTLSLAKRSEAAMPNDQDTLVALAREGDRAAFDALVRASYEETYTLAFRLTGNEEDARDVAQEAYLRAFRGIRRFRGDALFSTWMYRITANCAATQMGRRQRHRHDELHDDAPVTDDRPEHDPQVAADAGALRERVKLEIEQLPPRLRAVVVLRDIYDLSHGDIARELGISESAAKVRLHRARRRLRERLFPMPGEESSDTEGEERAHAV